MIAIVVMSFVPAGASAVPTAVSPSDVPGCWVTPTDGVAAVSVRLHANEDARRLGILQAGERATAA